MDIIRAIYLSNIMIVVVIVLMFFGYGDFDGDGNSDGGCFVVDDDGDNCGRYFLVFLFSPVYVVLLQ